MAPEYLYLVELCRPTNLSSGRLMVTKFIVTWKISTRKVKPQDIRSFWTSNVELTSGRNKTVIGQYKNANARTSHSMQKGGLGAGI